MKNFRSILCVALFSISAKISFSQSACPSVNAGPDVTVCGGCVTLNGTVQGSVATTSYTMAAVPYLPFSYNSGTSVLVGVDDQWSDTINLPFCFQFMGNTYTTVVLGSNGVVSFDLTNANGGNTWPIGAPMPDNTVFDMMNCIMGPWHDIDPSVAGNMYWDLSGVAPCRRLVVSWDQIPMFQCNNLIDRQQIVLYETTNIIDVYIENKPICTTWNGGAAIEGTNDITGTIGYIVPGRNYPTQWSVTNDGYRWTPAGAPQYTFNWLQNNVSIGTTPSISVCPTVTTTYVAQVVNQTCSGPITVTDTVKVTIGNGSLTLVTSQTPTTCTGSTGTATGTPTGTGPYAYSWAPSGQTTQTITGLPTGTYTCYVTDANGCQASATITVLASNNTLNLTSTSTPSNCTANNGTAIVTVTGGNGPYTFAWSPSGGTNANATGLGSGSYTVLVTDANGCTATTTIVVPQNNNSLSVSIASPPIICAGSSTNLTATVTGGTGPYTYSWVPGNQSTSTISVSPTSTTSYNCYITDANGCTALQTVTVTVDPPLVVNSNGINTICSGTSTMITSTVTGGNPSYTYSWAPGGGTTSNVLVSPTTTTTYTLYITDASGCTGVSGGVTVTVIPSPVANFSFNPNTTTPNNVIQFTDASTGSPTIWSWSFGDNGTSTLQNPNHLYLLPGTYNVCLWITAGICSDSICRTYLVEPIGVGSPNIITPNGDRRNDSLAFTNLEFYPGSSLKIYNRWGSMVYESSDYKNDWQGGSLSDGTYYFVLVMPGVDVPKSGYFEMLRKK